MSMDLEKGQAGRGLGASSTEDSLSPDSTSTDIKNNNARLREM